MKDTHPIELPSPGGIEAVALNEKEIQGVWRWRRQRLATGPGALELCCWRSRVPAGGREMDISLVLLQAHASPKVREA